MKDVTSAAKKALQELGGGRFCTSGPHALNPDNRGSPRGASIHRRTSSWSHQGSPPARTGLQAPQQMLLLPHATHCQHHPSNDTVQGRTRCSEEEDEGLRVRG